MWSVILIIELNFLKGLFFVTTRSGPLDLSSAKGMIIFILPGGALLAGGYYFYNAQKLNWACGIVGLPLAVLLLYFFIFLILPYLMGERMN